MSEAADPVVVGEQERPSWQQQAARVAKILDDAQVPNIFFGYNAASLVTNVEFNFHEIEIIVPDDRIQCAIDAIVASGRPLCENRRCKEFQEKLEIDEDYDARAPFNTCHAVAHAHSHHPHLLSLYRKSDLLWWLPDSSVGGPQTEDANLILTTDLNQQPWVDLHPVTILNRRAFIEALILLLCRDTGRNSGREVRWHAMFTSFTDDPEQPAPEVTLADEFMPFWTHCRDIDNLNSETTEMLLVDLHDKLVGDNGVVTHPAYRSNT